MDIGCRDRRQPTRRISKDEASHGRDDSQDERPPGQVRDGRVVVGVTLFLDDRRVLGVLGLGVLLLLRMGLELGQEV